MTDTTQLVLPNQQFWVLLIGAFVPLAGYLINKVAPWESETFKGIVQVALIAIGGVAYTAIAGDVKGAADFIQQTFTAIISGLFAHNILWKPAGLSVVFGANPPSAERKPEGFMQPGASATHSERARPSRFAVGKRDEVVGHLGRCPVAASASTG